MIDEFDYWVPIIENLKSINQSIKESSLTLFLNPAMSSFFVAGSDNKIFIWNVGTGEVITEVDFPDIPLSAAWNWDGSRFVTACKDRKIRIVDPRTGKIVRVSIRHTYL